MKKFTFYEEKEQSFLFPVITSILGLIWFIYCFPIGRKTDDIFKVLIAGVPFLGGIISFLLTAVFKVNTSDTFSFRIKFLGISIIFCILGAAFCFTPLLFLPFILIIVRTFYIFFHVNAWLEFIVSILADPLIYYVIYVIVALATLTFNFGG